MSDFRKLSINGHVTIKNGDKTIVDRGKNAIVRQGMRHFVACMTYNYIYAHRYNSPDGIYRGSMYTPYIRFGKGVNKPTTQLMDDLVSTISVNPSAISNTSGILTAPNGICTKFTASWPSQAFVSALSGGGMLGELGIYLGLFASFGIGDVLFNCDAVTIDSPEILFSRFNLGDSAFVPDHNFPVVVDWEFGWEFV